MAVQAACLLNSLLTGNFNTHPPSSLLNRHHRPLHDTHKLTDGAAKLAVDEGEVHRARHLHGAAKAHLGVAVHDAQVFEHDLDRVAGGDWRKEGLYGILCS